MARQFRVIVVGARTYVRLSRFLGIVRSTCRSHGLGGIVIAEDNVGHATGAFTRVAKENRIPCLNFPYTVANTREFAESY